MNSPGFIQKYIYLLVCAVSGVETEENLQRAVLSLHRVGNKHRSLGLAANTFTH